jgi:hypothetical protein
MPITSEELEYLAACHISRTRSLANDPGHAFAMAIAQALHAAVKLFYEENGTLPSGRYRLLPDGQLARGVPLRAVPGFEIRFPDPLTTMSFLPSFAKIRRSAAKAAARHFRRPAKNGE